MARRATPALAADPAPAITNLGEYEEKDRVIGLFVCQGCLSDDWSRFGWTDSQSNVFDQRAAGSEGDHLPRK
jgi:hypothetical protein